jgi:hypothetical protein
MVDQTMTEHLKVLRVVIVGCSSIVEGVGKTHPVDRNLKIIRVSSQASLMIIRNAAMK